MKTKKYSFLSFIIIPISVLTIVSGCKKDDDDKDDQPAIKTYRLTELNENDGSETFKTKVEYTSDNKVSKILGFIDEVNVFKTEWTYTGNKAVVKDLELTDDGWIADSTKTEYIYANGHIAEVNFYNAGDSIDFNKEYTWNGNNLAEENIYFSSDYMGGSEDLVITIKYNYEGGLLKSADWYMQDVIMRKQVIEYNNNAPVSLKSYDFYNNLDESTEFIYAENKISKVNYYNVTDGSQGNVYCYENRTYDANKNVSSTTSHCANDEQDYTTNITWEEGTGNLQDVFLASYSYISAYIFPDYPSQFALKKK